ncbi:MAG: cytochrome c [Pseudomonadota bacterium]
MKFLSSGIGALSVILLCACDKGSAPPAKVDIELAAKTWNTAQRTWSEPDLYLLEKGRSLYQKNCAACHLSSGEGQQTIGAPALKGSVVATGPAEALITTVLNGRNSMPAFGHAVDDVDLAAILSYVRNAWGNNAAEVIGAAAVTSARGQIPISANIRDN